jgi:hypothetical protein
LSAGPPPQVESAARQRAYLLVRDAISQLARACFEVKGDHKTPFPIILAWEPTIAHIVLSAARHIGPGRDPLVTVYITKLQYAQDRRHLKLADWTRGALINGVQRRAQLDDALGLSERRLHRGR